MPLKRPLAAAFNQGKPPVISLVNKATVALGVEWKSLADALQLYVNDFLAPAWSTPATLVRADAIQPGSWGMVFTDNATVAQALGYHDLSPDGLPLSHIFVETTLQDGEQVSVTASHELAEMLIDPAVQMGAFYQPRNVWAAYEICDACERLSFDVNGVAVSDFVLPSYFEGFRSPGSTAFDHLGQVRQPFQILPGGYLPVYVRGRWTQIFGAGADKKKVHPRLELRRKKTRQCSRPSAA